MNKPKGQGSDSCKTCRYYEPDKDGHGYCHRYPPTVAQARCDSGASVYPVVLEANWCGEFKV